MTRTFALAAFAAAASAGAWAAVPYSPEPGAGAGEPGALQWHGADGAAPYLSVEDFSGERRVVSDPLALRREAWEEICIPDYSMSASAGVSTSNGWWLVFDAFPRGGEAVSRTVALSPASGWEIRRVEAEVLRDSNAYASRDFEIDGGRAFLEVRTMPLGPPPDERPADYAFRVVRVLAARAGARHAAPDDLTRGDYRYVDPLGEASLGGLRPWVLSRLEGHRGDDWSRYHAVSPVFLAGQPLVFDARRQYRVETGLPGGTQAEARLMVGARAAVVFQSEVATNSAALRIMDFSFDPGGRKVSVKCSDYGFGHVIEASDSPLGSAMVWSELETEAEGRTDVGGVPCVALSAEVPAGWERAFFRVGALIGDTRSASASFRVPLIAEGGVILVAPNGSRWRLAVGNDGTLSTVAYP